MMSSHDSLTSGQLDSSCQGAPAAVAAASADCAGGGLASDVVVVFVARGSSRGHDDFDGDQAVLSRLLA